MKQPRARTICNRARFQLLHSCCEEPFRIFFPVGVLLGVVGVSDRQLMVRERTQDMKAVVDHIVAETYEGLSVA